MLASTKRLRIPSKMRNMALVAIMVAVCLQTGGITLAQDSASLMVAPELQRVLLSPELLAVQDFLEPNYFYVLPEWREAGYSEVEGVHITIDPWDFVDWADPSTPTNRSGKWSGIMGWNVGAAIWDKRSPELPGSRGSGNGPLQHRYRVLPVGEASAPPWRDIMINGEYQFNESEAHHLFAHLA